MVRTDEDMSISLVGGPIRMAPTRLPDEIAAQLTDDILEGRLRPGQALNLNELAAALSVSRTPLREAIGQLASLGLVEVEPSRWTRVADITPESTAEAAELAAHVGAAIAHAAVPRLASGTPGSTAPARALGDMSSHARDATRLLLHTDAFLGELAKVGGRRHFARLWEGSRLMIRFQLGGSMPSSRLRDAPAQIARIGNALSARDAEGVATGIRALFVTPPGADPAAD